VNDLVKQEFLANASGLLFPIDWPEPFGLLMIEAMASGTPVYRFPAARSPEIVEDGLYGSGPLRLPNFSGLYRKGRDTAVAENADIDRALLHVP